MGVLHTLAFTQEELKSIGLLITKGQTLLSKHGSTELEIRLRKVSERGFYSAIRRLASQPNKGVAKTNDTVFSKGAYRQITQNTLTISNSIFQHKIKEKPLDIDVVVAFKPLEVMPIRFGLAVEKDISEEEFARVNNDIVIRKRERTQFIYDGFSIDFTRVENSLKGDNDVSYEIEIEILQSALNSVLSSEWKKTFVTILKDSFHQLYPRLHTLFSNERFVPFSTSSLALPPKRDDKKPINIQDSHLKNGLTNYHVTNKLDGVGYNLIFMEKLKKVYVILQSNVDTWLLNTLDASSYAGIENLVDTVLKCEVVEIRSEVELHLFDILAFKKDTSVFYKPFSQRLALIQKLESKIKGLFPSWCKVETKRFFSSSISKTTFGDLAKDVHQTVQYMCERYASDGYFQAVIDHNDGIIFQPEEQAQSIKPILKWKFPSKITIDFVLTDRRIIDGTVEYNLRTQGHAPFYLDRAKHVEQRSASISFDISETIDNVSVTELENVVVECGWSVLMGDSKEPRFLAQRIRFDKRPEDANHEKVARDHYYDMTHELTLPILIEKLGKRSKKGCKMIREVNNQIKREMILKWCGNKSVLDIGSGKGGDLQKYDEARVSKLVLTEPNPVNYQEMLRRLKMLKMNAETHLIKGDEIASQVSGEYDVVSAFFCFTFFFDREEHLDRVLDGIKEKLNNNGVFIGTCMFGDELREQLQESKEIVTNCYSIKALDLNDTSFGNKIEIDIFETATATRQTEYLVFWETLKSKMLERGFTVLDDSRFDVSDESLSAEEKALNRLCRRFVFAKTTELKEEETKDSISPQFRDLVTVPTKGDGSCLFHAVMMSVLGKDYSVELSRAIRQRLAEDYFDIEDYEGLQGVMQGDLIDFLTLHNDIFERAGGSISTDDVLEMIKNDRQSAWERRLGRDDYEILEGIKVLCYEARVENLKDCSWYAEEWTIEWLSGVLGINILVWSKEHNQMVLSRMLEEDWLSVIVANEDDHFEQTGIRSEQSETIKFVFNTKEIMKYLI